MNKYSYGMVNAFLGILCLGTPTLAQAIQTHKSTRPSFFTSKVEPGQFTITLKQPDGSVAIEIYDAPLEPVIQAVAKLANRKLLISDDAREKLKTYTGNTFKIKTPTLEAAFSFLASGFSVGKIGKDTYLLVVRENSAVEVAAEKTEQTKLKEKLQVPQTQKPEQDPMKGRLYLLPVPFDTRQNQ